MSLSASASPAYYLPLPRAADGAERFASTEHTVGPWSAQMQHLSPPSALLVRALQRCAPRPGTRLTRVTVEVLGPVPRADLTVRASVVRPGRQVELLAAELTTTDDAGDERTVVRASAWRMATTDTTAVAVSHEEPLAPAGAGSTHQAPAYWVPGYLDSVEWSWISGFLSEAGPGSGWGRPRVQLVAGEKLDPLESLFAVVDSANGMAAPLDVRKWTFLNTDLTVHLYRQPVGEWTGVSATTSIGPDGVGLCAATLHDEAGPVGRSEQILLVRPR
ncbi:thioesterase family protein [Rhodococcus sp. X156]|uniref:thioesterase family protein n=1 Tax=Rhodococcus sp. X156 TaxID=2499145 RepID=UPI000FDCB7A1|nr:thioesterase family protein [Rhodococcus sp. X156]